jgi:hypothetical protein
MSARFGPSFGSPLRSSFLTPLLTETEDDDHAKLAGGPASTTARTWAAS